MTKKLKHPPWPWFDWKTKEWLYECKNLLANEDSAILITLAATAPHDCSDPYCPGNVNRLKLKAYGKLQASHDRLVEACCNLIAVRDSCYSPLWNAVRAELPE